MAPLQQVPARAGQDGVVSCAVQSEAYVEKKRMWIHRETREGISLHDSVGRKAAFDAFGEELRPAPFPEH